jgi:hypothetical protein
VEEVDSILFERTSMIEGLELLNYLFNAFDAILIGMTSVDEIVVKHCMRSVITQVGLELQKSPLSLLPFLDNGKAHEKLLESFCGQFTDELPPV